jgi:hypothetical protein
MSFFKPQWLVKRRSVLDVIEEQLNEAEKVFIANQGTAEHYQALADGNERTIARLKASRAAKLDPQPSRVAQRAARPKMIASVSAVGMSGTGVKLASSK